ELPTAAIALFTLGLLGQTEELLRTLPLERKGNDVQATLHVKPGIHSQMFALSGVSAGLLIPAVQKTREAASRMQNQNNLKEMALAMHNYHDVNGKFPPAAICDKQGKPLLSWRVAILPYVEQDNLYKQFKLDEPWDSEHNKKLIAQMPKVYALPRDPKPGEKT